MSDIKKHVLTKEGLKTREEELEQLRTVKRKEIAEKIKVAMSFGDLSENSEYDEAKNEQAKLEARIADLEAMLKNVKIIDESELNNETIHVGSKIEIKDMKFKEVSNYKIVGSSESNPLAGFISDESPIGKTMLGHKVGDTVAVETPDGVVKYKVMKINK